VQLGQPPAPEGFSARLTRAKTASARRLIRAKTVPSWALTKFSNTNQKVYFVVYFLKHKGN